MANILVVEDERAINQLICSNLTLVGHQCRSAYSGKEAKSLIVGNSFDLAILDVMLPDTDGFALFAQIRPIPAIFLTARGELIDRIRGLNMGADDYIVKPFEVQEMIARINAVLRRAGKISDRFVLGDTVVDMAAHTATVCGEPVELAPREFALLEVLIQNCNIALTREQILSMAWNADYYGDDRTVDVHIQKLRKKLMWEKNIRTLYKIGYRLETNV